MIKHLTESCTCSGKTCTKCHRELCVEGFYRAQGYKGGRRSMCKVCVETYRRTYRNTHSDQARERRKTYYQANSEHFKQKLKDYNRTHREKYLPHFVVNHARQQARKYQATGEFTVQEWLDLKAHYNYTCLCCGKREPDCKLTPDHVIPFSKGGTNGIDNIQPLCFTCNRSKNAKTMDYRPSHYTASADASWKEGLEMRSLWEDAS